MNGVPGVGGDGLPEVRTFKFKGLVKQANSVFVATPLQERRTVRNVKRKRAKRPHQLDLDGSSFSRRSNRRSKPNKGKLVDRGKKRQRPEKRNNYCARGEKSERVLSAGDSAQTGNEKNGYERLMLSLGSPLPNEHQLALGACLRLSAVGDKVPQEVNLIGENPEILRMLLAHARFYEDCGMRAMMEEVFLEAFGLNFASFWKELCGNDQQLQGLLCECYQGELTKLSGEEMEIWFGGQAGGMIASESLKCCGGCQYVPALEKMQSTVVSPEIPFTLASSSGHSHEKLEKRVQLVGTILSNFSFQSEDAVVMARSATLLRFLFLTAKIKHPTLSRIAFDIISNISRYMGSSKDNTKGDKTVEEYQQLVTLLVNLMMTVVLSSSDRFKITRGLEALEGIVKGEDNQLITMVARRELFARVLQLLIIKQDVLLISACLNYLETMSEVGKEFCEGIARAHGSISTLISYLTVDFLGSKCTVGTGEEFNAELAKTITSEFDISEPLQECEEDPRILSPIAPSSLPMCLPRILVPDRNGTVQSVNNQHCQMSTGSHHDIVSNEQLPIAINFNNSANIPGRRLQVRVKSDAVPLKIDEAYEMRKMLKVTINGNIRVVNMQLFPTEDNKIFFSMDQLRKQIFPYPCLWEACNVRAPRMETLYWHVLQYHCSKLTESTCCRWDIHNRAPEQSESCSLLRGKLSLLTHLQRCHFGNKDLELGGLEQADKINSANCYQQLHSNFGPLIEKTDSAQEGDAVSNSVRLTAAIILRNLAKCSSAARRSLAVYEPHLVEMVMREYDCSAMVAKILHCINLGNNQEQDF